MINLSTRKLTDTEYRLLGKGLTFCPKLKSHDKIKLAEETYKFTRRLRLKEYFYDRLNGENEEYSDSENDYSELPFFNKKRSTFIPRSGRDQYLDFYIDIVTQEILSSLPKKRKFTNISKEELFCLKSLAKDQTIVMKKADKSGLIVVMNRKDYVDEVQRQLNNDKYYQRLETDFSSTAASNITECVSDIENTEPHVMDEFDTFPTQTRIPQFYILPKVHKTFDNNLPFGYPGRPIVSACNSCTDHISKYIDSVLQPFMQSLPSYIKDTSDFLAKLKQHKLNHGKTYLVTLDVSSLYTNIPHEEGIDACKHFMENNNYNGNLSIDNICKLIRVVLENNFFQFDNVYYLQKLGTAMGSPMAPAFASLFMGKLEQTFLNTCELRPDIWFRFLDDIFMTWSHSLDDLNIFIDKLNNIHPFIKFTYNISESNVTFLDVDVSIDGTQDIVTNVHVKQTNVHQYVEYSSCHPKPCKDGIPYSQAKRYRRICSDDVSFFNGLDQLRNHFMIRNYPESVIDTAFEKVKCMSQEKALETGGLKKCRVVPFVIEYNTSLPNIGHIINKYWDILKLSDNPAVQLLHKYKPTMAFKRPKNIRDILVRTKLQSSSDDTFNSSKCKHPRCTHCSNISETDCFYSSQNKKTYKLRCNATCKSSDVIYLITCKKCNKQYVGETSQQVSKRMNSHRFDINNYTDPAFSTQVAVHFNTKDHNLADFSFMPIDVVHDKMHRLLKETYWIHKLDTVFPNGLNTKILYSI